MRNAKDQGKARRRALSAGAAGALAFGLLAHPAVGNVLGGDADSLGAFAHGGIGSFTPASIDPRLAAKLGARALLYYLVPYAAMSLGAFAVVAARERELGVPVTFENMAGFGWERPLLGVSMWAFMLGFAGFPLTGGFIGKFYVFAAGVNAGVVLLVLAGALNSVISLYYYFRIVKTMFLEEPQGEGLVPLAEGAVPHHVGEHDDRETTLLPGIEVRSRVAGQRGISF